MEDDLGELIYLADPPGTSGHVVSLRVLARPAPGGDVLDCEFVVETETVKGSFPVYVTSDDLDEVSPQFRTLVRYAARACCCRCRVSAGVR
ncbi:DUF5959 family protein [Streptomyces sp. NPDC055632]